MRADVAQEVVDDLPQPVAIAEDGGQRRAQLVRGVGDEAPQLSLGCLARLERRLDLAEHRVERETEAAHFGALLRSLDPFGEVARGDRAGGLLDRAERAQPQADDPEARAAER